MNPEAPAFVPRQGGQPNQRELSTRTLVPYQRVVEGKGTCLTDVTDVEARNPRESMYYDRAQQPHIIPDQASGKNRRSYCCLLVFFVVFQSRRFYSGASFLLVDVYMYVYSFISRRSIPSIHRRRTNRLPSSPAFHPPTQKKKLPSPPLTGTPTQHTQ